MIKLFQFTTFLALFLLIQSSLFSQTYLRDSSFGVNGISRIKSNDTNNQMSYNTWATGFGLQKDGKIIAIHAPLLNSILYGPVISHGLIRFTNDGKKIDSSLGNNGISERIFNPLSSVSSNFNGAFTSSIIEDGRILVGGQKKSHNPPSTYLASLVCFLSNGDVDSSFSDQGVFLHNPFPIGISGGHSRVINIFSQSETRIILHCASESSERNYLLAITANGQIDSSYGINGIQNFQLFNLPNELQFYNGVVLLPSGELIVHESRYDSIFWTQKSENLLKFKTDGLIDSSFGVNGIKQIDTSISIFNSINNLYFNHFHSQGTNKIISLLNSKNGDFKSLVRFKIDGSIDSSFGNNGISEFQFNSSSGIHNTFYLESFKVLANEYIAMTGRALDSNSTTNSMDVIVVLLKPNGTIDSSFANQGISIIDGGVNINDQGVSIISSDSSSFIICGSDDDRYYEMIKFKNPLTFPTNIGSQRNIQLSIYPNPTTQSLIVECPKQISELFIYNNFGAIILSESVENFKTKINISNFTKGQYLIKCILENKSEITSVFIKN